MDQVINCYKLDNIIENKWPLLIREKCSESEKIYNDFIYEIYDGLPTVAEKIRYIAIFTNINETDLHLLTKSIDYYLSIGFVEDFKYASIALCNLIQLNVPIHINEDICTSFIEKIEPDSMFETYQFLIFNFFLQNNSKIPKKILDLLTDKILVDKNGMNPQMMKFTSKLIKYFNFQIPIDFFEYIIHNVDDFSFIEKKIYTFKLCNDFIK